MEGRMSTCTLDVGKHYSCIICNKEIHGGDEGCSCSTFRHKTFSYASLCMRCARAFDRLMSDEELQPILKHLLNKEFWRGAGPVIDF